MRSIFRKLISFEFGEKEYYKYFFSCEKQQEVRRSKNLKIEEEEIFHEIYKRLEPEESSLLTEKMNRLKMVLEEKIHINRMYSKSLLFCVFAALFLMILNLEPLAITFGLLGIGACIIYKTYEYLINNSCFIDAHIILVYKSVLDKLIGKQHNRTDN